MNRCVFGQVKHPKLSKNPVADIMEHDITQTAISNKPLMSQTETSHKLMPFWTAKHTQIANNPVPDVTNCNVI